MRRRSLLGGTSALLLGGCPAPPLEWQGGWVGAALARGHRLRASTPLPAPARQRRTGVLVVGAGVAGLAAARALVAGGVDDVRVLDLEDHAGGNSRAHRLAGQPCPLGAHYLPLPGPQARAVADWLHELGLLRQELGRTVADERHLCHSPQERLFFDGSWHAGLLPPVEPGSSTAIAYQQFARAVEQAGRDAAFAMPTRAAPWRAAHAALDAQTFSQWLDTQGLRAPLLRAYLDYCCRDDYGAGIDTVSAWAGLHYFASRHGFAAPGDEAGERDAVFTWPEGNAWLVRRLAQPLGERVVTSRTVLRVDEGRHGVQALAWDEAAGTAEAWSARAVVLAVPLWVARRLLATPPAALADAVARQRHAPWLVANLLLREPLLDRGTGAPPAWDNVVHGSAALGYVDAGHQGLRPDAPQRVITAYWALPESQRAALAADPWRPWAQRVVDELAPVHPDLPGKLERADLMRYGHAMSVPVPGLRGAPALAALGAQAGRVRFAHADLASYSVFEEAFTVGTEAGRSLAAWLR